MSRRESHIAHAARRLAEVETYEHATGRLTTIRRAKEALEAATVQAVIEARQQGESWAEVGHCLGITKQAAQQRYGAAVKAAPVMETRGYPETVAAQANPEPEQVPGQDALPLEDTEATDVDDSAGPWVCGNCGSDEFPRVNHTDWCSYCHGASDAAAAKRRADKTCGWCGMGSHTSCQFHPKSKTYTTGQPISVGITEDERLHWQCACSLTHTKENH